VIVLCYIPSGADQNKKAIPRPSILGAPGLGMGRKPFRDVRRLADGVARLEEWSVTDRLFLDGEQARPGFELVRSVELSGPPGRMRLRRDPLDFDGARETDLRG